MRASKIVFFPYAGFHKLFGIWMHASKQDLYLDAGIQISFLVDEGIVLFRYAHIQKLFVVLVAGIQPRFLFAAGNLKPFLLWVGRHILLSFPSFSSISQ